MLAFDRAPGQSYSFDRDGRLRVRSARLSKAQIRPYKGEEIPDAEAMGLDLGKVYKLLCPPEELKKAAETFNGIQLLRKHFPVDVNDHKMWDIVGTTGSEARFEFPYLKNSLFIWTREGIDLIESGEQRELSCGYYYEPDMVEGEFEGAPYDGIMTNIRGNHVALVASGRAGSDCSIEIDENVRGYYHDD